MNRHELLQSLASAATIAMLPKSISARGASRPDWEKLKRAVGGNLIQVSFPLNDLAKLKNPYYIGDQPGLTQTLGWVDA